MSELTTSIKPLSDITAERLNKAFKDSCKTMESFRLLLEQIKESMIRTYETERFNRTLSVSAYECMYLDYISSLMNSSVLTAWYWRRKCHKIIRLINHNKELIKEIDNEITKLKQ